MTKYLLFVSSFLFLSGGEAAGQDRQTEETKYIGVASGYRHFLIRDELESFRNFSGGSIPVGVFYGNKKPGTNFRIHTSAAWARLSSANSGVEMKTFVSNVDFTYLWDLMIEKWQNTTLYGGVKLANQASARSLFFNSPIGGQDPFTGEFISAPGAVFELTRTIDKRLTISWKVGWSPLAYLISRDYHPIRGFQTFGDIPKGMVFTNRFSDIDSELSCSLAIGRRVWLATGYRWRYLYYKRAYSYQLASHEWLIRLAFNPKK